MAIEQLGESLLSDVRNRNEQAAKRARKEEEKDALLGLGVSLSRNGRQSNIRKQSKCFF
jgi:hypothetical protein